MTSVLKRASNGSISDRGGLCRATTRKGEACRRKALDTDGLCLVHNGSQDMRELGRKGGRAIPKAKRQDAEREGYRAHLRRELDPSDLTQAIKTGLASPNERDRLAAAKLAFAELSEPAVERQRADEAETARARAQFELTVDAISRRRILQDLVEAGVIRPGEGRPFEGAVMFELRALAEWVGHWTPRPLEVSDVTCSTCGKAGVRLVKEGEAVDGGPVYCATCQPAEASSLAPPAVPSVLPVEEPVEEQWPRRSLA